jgi:hypothetical protein
MDRQDPYISALQARLSMPLVACLPFLKVPDAQTLAPQFDLTHLA